MKRLLHQCNFLLLLIALALPAVVCAQTTINTGLPSSSGSLIGGSTPTGVLFTIENTNSYAILITSMDVFRGSGSSGATYSLLYHPTSLSGASNVLTGGWLPVTSATASTVTSTNIYPTFTGFSFTIPANTTYRFALTSSVTTFYYGGSTTSVNMHTGGGLIIGTGNYQIGGLSVGYSGSGGNFTTQPRFWAGSITFSPAVPCTFPPVGGSATVSNANPCMGSPIDLNVTGNTGGTGQTYQWESSSTLAGPYTPVGSVQNSGLYSITATGTLYYRVVVTCNASTDASLPVLVSVPAPFPAGTYTINSALPTGSGNFTSFTDAAAAIHCGVTGPIIFNVTPNTYANDRFALEHYINAPGVSVTINGNGAILSNLSATPGNAGIISLDGTKNVTVNDLNIQGISTSTTQYAAGVFMTNGADSNTIANCTIVLDTTTTSANYVGIAITGSSVSATTAGSNCDGITITNNTIIGGYYGITLMGNPTINDNKITNNTIRNFYTYGMYIGTTNNTLIEGNDVHRLTRPSASTFYGTFITGATTNLKISKNRYHDPFQGLASSTSASYVIYLSSADATTGNENIISNNLIYNFNKSTGLIYALYNVGSNNARYYHNTISLDDAASVTINATKGLYQSTAATGIELKNNIFNITRGGTGTNHGLHYNTAGTTVTADYNNFNIAGSSGLNYVGEISTGTSATLGAWQTATSQDLNSEIQNPLFSNAAAGDLTPTNGALDDQGTFVGIATDILGNPRSLTTPDIGGIEFLNSPLAVSMGDIAATNFGRKNRVDWSTLSEENTVRFVVERSLDGKNFTSLSSVKAQGAAATYTWWDDEAVIGVNYYRLKMTEASGRHEYSNVVSATVKGTLTFSMDAYPNPVADVLSLRVSGTSVNDALVSVTDIRGATISSYKMHNGTLEIDMSQMAKGTYLVRYYDGVDSETLKVAKQ